MEKWVLAVDFGTTCTSAAMAYDNKIELVEVDGSTRMPSVVFLNDDGALDVGKVAENQAVLAPERFERTPKRRLGDRIMLLGGQPVEVIDVVAAILKRVAAEAMRLREGVPPAEVRLTHPARWGAPLRDALREAARRANLPEPVLIPEPVAAAIHFAGERLSVGDCVAVYDLGGGTFDTAVLRRTSDGFEVIGAPGGIERLGGEDFDEFLYQTLGPRLGEEKWAALQTSPERKWRRTNLAMRRSVRDAKEALSTSPQYILYVPDPVDHDLLVTVLEFEQLIMDEVAKTTDVLVDTIEEAGLSPAKLTAVYLAGGSSRIPLVTHLIGDRLQRVPNLLDEPKTVVALGAARGTAPHGEGGGNDGVSDLQPQPTPAVPNYLVQAILVTVLCCCPVGIAAIVFASRANSKAAAGDYQGAIHSAKKAKKWCWVAFGIGISIFALILAAAG